MSGIVEQLVQFGKVTRPILGIKFAPDQSVEQLGVSGVLVLDAPANGPAGKAVFISSLFSLFISILVPIGYSFQYSIMVPRTPSDRFTLCRACYQLSGMLTGDLYWET